MSSPRAELPRLSGTSYAVLGLIGHLQPCSPYDLKRFLEQSVEHFWQVPHTTFYAEPARLAAAGLLTERQERSGRRRKLYALTAAGRRALASWLQQPGSAPAQVRDEMTLRIFLGADPAPLLAERLGWHEEQLAELEGYLGQLRPSVGEDGIERSLRFGCAYHRSMIDLVRDFRMPAKLPPLGVAPSPAQSPARGRGRVRSEVGEQPRDTTSGEVAGGPSAHAEGRRGRRGAKASRSSAVDAGGV